jgi:hypothetical protein
MAEKLPNLAVKLLKSLKAIIPAGIASAFSFADFVSKKWRGFLTF